MFDKGVQYEMKAPDGSVIHRCVIQRAGWYAARWKGKIYPVLGGIRGPLWLSTSWGTTKA